MKLLLLFLLPSCAVSAVPQTPPLVDALRLETRIAVGSVRAGATVPVRFELRNVAQSPFEFCQTDGAVSIWVRRAGSVEPRPVLLSGMVLDAPCYGRTSLQPGEAKQFTANVPIAADVSGDVDVLALIRVHRVPEQQGSTGESPATIRASPVHVWVDPAG